MKYIRHLLLILLSFIGLPALAQKADALMQLPPIQRAALIIKRFEGWHGGKGQYIGWGHRVQPGEKFSHNITHQQGDSILYEDLRKLFNQFKGYGDYALLDRSELQCWSCQDSWWRQVQAKQAYPENPAGSQRY